VHEDILAAVIGLYKSIALGRVEPLHSTCCHFGISSKKTDQRDSSDKLVATRWQKAVAVTIQRRLSAQKVNEWRRRHSCSANQDLLFARALGSSRMGDAP